jgi:hypothetical protein
VNAHVTLAGACHHSSATVAVADLLRLDIAMRGPQADRHLGQPVTPGQPALPTLEPAKWVPTDRQPARAPTGASWADFAEWVAWLDDAYELNLPTCWAQHDGVGHILAALWDAWLAVYSRPRKG